MRRKRKQSGQLFKVGEWWYLRYYDSRVVDRELKRVRIAKRIAPLTGVNRRKAGELAQPILDNINRGAQRPETALLLSDFVEGEYLPRMKELKRPSTYSGYRDIWENHLKPRCSKLWLRDTRTCDIQGSSTI